MASESTAPLPKPSENGVALAGELPFSGEDGPPSVPARARKPKKKKFALLMAFSGKGYAGMQINPGVSTIEGELFRALRLEGLIEEKDVDKPGNFTFQRAARTDKGVSAVRQVCSLMIPILDHEARELPARLNSHLPPQIRAIGGSTMMVGGIGEVKRAVRSFDSKKSCDSRTYSYTLPTFAFATVKELTNEEFRLSEERRQEVNDLLSKYIGTHNFFNYTSRREHGDMSCNRYIMAFECGEAGIVERGGRKLEMATIKVHGQSFMMHQIRKMIGMCIAVIRGFQKEGAIEESWSSQRMDVPMAPGLGLLLERPHFAQYDQKFGDVHVQLDTWEKEDEIEAFRRDVIMPEILDTEIEQRSMLSWLESLMLHEFNSEDEKDEEVPDPKRPRLSLPELHKSVQEAQKEEEKQQGEESPST